MTREERLTYKQSEKYKYKKARNLQYFFSVLSWVSLILPEGILLGVNWNEWITTQLDTIKVSMGLVICVLVSLFALYKKIKKTIKFNQLGLVVSFWLGTGIIYLLDSLLTQMVLILAVASIGMTVSLLIDIPSEYYRQEKLEHKAKLIEKGEMSETPNKVLEATKNVLKGKKVVEEEKEHTRRPIE